MCAIEWSLKLHIYCIIMKLMVPILLGLDRIALAALAKLLNTPPTTAAKPGD